MDRNRVQVSCYRKRLASVLEPQSEFLIATRTRHRKDAVMACSCDSCSSPRIIKTRTALFWRWRAQSRGETADRVIPAPVRAPDGRVTLAR